MADYEAERLWNAFHTDPVGTYQAVGDQLAEAGLVATEDPRVAEMYADYQRQQELAAYDAEIEHIVNDPANADINPNRFHAFVAAANGDFQAAVELYRADALQVMQDYTAAGGDTTPAPRDYRAEGLSPVDALHRAIEDATAMRHGRR